MQWFSALRYTYFKTKIYQLILLSGISYRVPITKFPSHKFPITKFPVRKFLSPKNSPWVQRSQSTKFPIAMFTNYNVHKLHIFRVQNSQVTHFQWLQDSQFNLFYSDFNVLGIFLAKSYQLHYSLVATFPTPQHYKSKKFLLTKW
jgi:hypothetical protein